MKNYLNKQELVTLVYVTLLVDQLEKMLKGWAEHDNLTEGEQEAAAAAVEAAKGFTASVLDRMKPDQRVRYIRACYDNDVYLRPRMTDWEFKLWMQREAEQDKKAGVWVEKDTAEALADLLLYKCCRPCCQEACDRESCPIKRVLTLMDIPMCDEYATGDKCPYDNGGE